MRPPAPNAPLVERPERDERTGVARDRIQIVVRRWVGPGLGATVVGLAWFDYYVSGTGDLVARLVASGFVAGLAANLLSVLIVVVGIEQVTSRIEADADRDEQERWRGVRDRMDSRVRLFASAAVSGLRPPPGARWA